MTIDELLKTPYWVIDIIPRQVPENSDGQYFTVEKYFLDPSRMQEIKHKHVNVILKLNCYKGVTIDDELNPPPTKIAQEMLRRYVWILTGDSMIISEPDDAHMTLFNPDEELLGLVRDIAQSEGLFVWQPEEGNG